MYSPPERFVSIPHVTKLYQNIIVLIVSFGMMINVKIYIIAMIAEFAELEKDLDKITFIAKNAMCVWP
jgi:hypothetical protein